MNQNLIETLNLGFLSIAQTVAIVREESPDSNAFDTSLAMCKFNIYWTVVEVGDDPMSDASDFALSNMNESDRSAWEFCVDFQRNKTGFVSRSRALEFARHMAYRSRQAISQLYAEEVFKAITASLESLLTNLLDATPEEFVAIRELATIQGYDTVFDFVVGNVEKAVGYPIFSEMLNASCIDGDDIEGLLEQMDVEADEYLMASAGDICANHSTHCSL